MSSANSKSPADQAKLRPSSPAQAPQSRTIPEKTRPEHEERIIVLFLVVTSLTVICSEAELLLYLAIHLTALLLLGVFLHLMAREFVISGLLLLMLLLGVIGGPIGCVAGGAAWALARVLDDWWGDEREWMVNLMLRGEREHAEQLLSEIVSLQAAQAALRDRRNNSAGALKDQIPPYLDIMVWGTLTEKQRALTQIVRNFTPGLMPALRRSLADRTGLVRVQAASTISTLEARLVEDEFRVARTLKKQASDLETLYELAGKRESRAQSGILDPVSERAVRCQAIDDYLEYAKHSGVNSRHARRRAANLLICGEQYDEALRLLEPLAQEEGPSSESFGNYMRCLFQLARFDEIRANVRRLPYVREQYSGAVEFWRQLGEHQFPEVTHV